MPDSKAVVTFLLGAIFNALVRTYSRQALYFALVASSSLYVLYFWRDWFGSSGWRVGSTLCVALAGSVASALWWFWYPGFDQQQKVSNDAPSKFAPRLVLDDFGVSNAAMAVNDPANRQRIVAMDISQSFVVIKNDPVVVDPASVAKNVRAQAVVFDAADPNKPLFTIEMQ